MKDYDYNAKPIRAWGYVGFSFLYLIPVVGQLIWLYNVLFAGNRNVKNHARSYLCMFLVLLLVVIVAAAVLAAGSFFELIDLTALENRIGFELPF